MHRVLSHLKQSLAAWCSLGLCVAACNGDEDASRSIEVSDFGIHECKRGPGSGELATGRETADYGGLECIAWRLSADSTAIDLINHGACQLTDPW